MPDNITGLQTRFHAWHTNPTQSLFCTNWCQTENFAYKWTKGAKKILKRKCPTSSRLYYANFRRSFTQQYCLSPAQRTLPV